MIQSAPIDAETQTKLEVIATDRVHEDDRAIVEAAVRQVAADHGGVVHPNDWRALLYNDHGCIVHPNVIGATIAALVRDGILRRSGYVTTQGSRSGNNGKPAMSYIYEGTEAA